MQVLCVCFMPVLCGRSIKLSFLQSIKSTSTRLYAPLIHAPLIHQPGMRAELFCAGVMWHIKRCHPDYFVNMGKVITEAKQAAKRRKAARKQTQTLPLPRKRRIRFLVLRAQSVLGTLWHPVLQILRRYPRCLARGLIRDV